MSGTSVALRTKALRVHGLLLDYYGKPVLKERRDPLSELVVTILSQNTSDVNSGRAYGSLRQRFPSWEDVLSAETAEIGTAIRMGGLANIKAPRIRAILRQLMRERGKLDLGFLEAMPTPKAREYLTSLPGVGPKTAACVLLFSLDKPALPVDTHVHRIAQRLGLIPTKATPEKANALLEELLPERTYYPFHLNFIRHGRTLCKKAKPSCATCPLYEECDFAQRDATAATPTNAEAQLTGDA
jgi:endonuclease-3